MTNRIRESFDAYLQRVGLADAGPVQKRELRRAFYAGCWEILCAVEVVRGAGVKDEPEAVALLGAMRVECEEFAGRVVEGKDWS